MLVFLDETFRVNTRTGRKFGVLAGLAIPEDIFSSFQQGIYDLRRPYHGEVLKEDDEIKGNELLRATTFRVRQAKGYSHHWNLTEELLQYARFKRLKVFGVVCFRDGLTTFVCDDETRLDPTFRYLFERIDRYMKLDFPGVAAKLIFDNRLHRIHEANARAITNFFVRSQIGLGYDSIIRVPFFAVSQGHNYGLQIADLLATVIGLKFQGHPDIDPLWNIVKDMLHHAPVGGKAVSSLKVMRELGNQ
jgi:Protein of unknown function (DUF3800)